jgi:hypothetical protein
MNDERFLVTVEQAFSPFLSRLGFTADDPSISGRYYRASFSGPMNSIWITFEPGDDELSIIIFTRENGRLSNIDDRSKTPRLSDLNSRYMRMVSDQARSDNEAIFADVVAKDSRERLMLKAAKELHLVLPKYLEALSICH